MVSRIVLSFCTYNSDNGIAIRFRGFPWWYFRTPIIVFMRSFISK